MKNEYALLIPSALSGQCHALKPRLIRAISMVLLSLGAGVSPSFAAGAKPDRIELAENWKLASATEAHSEGPALLSFWCLAPSPLMLGGNLPDNTDWDLSLLTNDEVLALDLDPAVKPAARLGSSGAAQGRTEVWLRELKDGGRAAGLFNRGETPEQATLIWDQAGLNGKWSVRDLWQHKDMGAFEGQFSIQVPAHGAVLLRAVRSTATTQ